MKPTLIIDFDSTFVTLESLDELARLALAESPHRLEIMKQLSNITDLGMEGKIDFGESLQRRLAMFEADQSHLNQLVQLLKNHITPSIARNRSFLRERADQIYIISGGFTDYIWPVVQQFGLKREHILANQFRFNAAGQVIGCNPSCLLAQAGGKVKQVAALKLPRPIIVIGDGYTDYEIRASGMAEKFLAFMENVSRPVVEAQADQVVTSFEEVISA